MVHIVHFAESWGGGVETYLKSLIASQNADPRFTKITLLTPDTGTRPFEDRPQLWTDKLHHATYHFDRSPLGLLKGFMSLRRTLPALDADIIYMHCTFPGFLGRLVRATTRGMKAGFAYIPHGWSFQQDRGTVINRLFATIERVLARWSDATVSVSHAELFTARAYGVRGPNDVVIQNGTRDVVTPPDGPSGPKDGPIQLGFVGRFDRQKGIEVLMEAFGQVKRQDIQLNIIGWSYLGDAALPALETPEPRVNLIGRVPNAEIDAQYRSFDALVLPSKFEGLPITALEAMRNGCPLIVSDRTSLPYIVIPGFNGHVFCYDEPETLVRVLETLDRDSLKQMGRNARHVFEDAFTDTAMCEATNDLLLSIAPR